MMGNYKSRVLIGYLQMLEVSLAELTIFQVSFLVMENKNFAIPASICYIPCYILCSDSTNFSLLVLQPILVRNLKARSL